eukprot:s346_g14.t1
MALRRLVAASAVAVCSARLTRWESHGEWSRTITSSAFGCTVATGPPCLDTGQTGEAAKNRRCDPPEGRLRDVVKMCIDYPTQDIDSVKQALELRRGSVLSWMVMGLMGDLASILKPMIAEMIKEVLQELLGGDGLKSMITGLLVGRQPGALTAGSGGTQSFASPKGKGKHADDGASAVAKAGRWQRGAKADVEGDDGQNGVSKHGGKGGQGAPGGKGNGKSSGDALAKGKGKDPGSAHAKGKGKGADLPDGDGGGEWTVEQKEILTSLYRGCGKSHALLLAVLQTGSDTERCPGSVGGALARQVRFTRACTQGLTAPGPETQIKAGKVDLVQSAVVYVRYVQKYLEKDVRRL